MSSLLTLGVRKMQKLPTLRFLNTSSYIKRQTHYEVLGVPKNASLEDIKNAFIDKSKQYHPDRHHGNEKMQAKFVRVNEAYTVLMDPEKRAMYNFKLGKFSAGSPSATVIRSKDYENPYAKVKGFTTDWSDFYSTYGGGKAERDMKADADSKYWKEYWEHTKKYGGGEMQDGPSPPLKSTLQMEMFFITAILIIMYVCGLVYSSSHSRSVDHDSFDSEHLTWLAEQKKAR